MKGDTKQVHLARCTSETEWDFAKKYRWRIDSPRFFFGFSIALSTNNCLHDRF